MRCSGFVGGALLSSAMLAFVVLPVTARAYPYDLSLVGLGRPDLDPAAQGRFRALSNELAIALAPRPLQPAETLGASGFEFSIANSLTSVSNKAAYWQGQPGMPIFDAPLRHRTVLQNLWTPTLHLRKGLPFSTEFGVQASYLAFTELFMLGGEFKIALHESYYRWLPAISARIAAARLVGSSQLSLFSVEGDAIASYTVGVGGMTRLTPYMGYGQLRVNAESSVLDATPATVSDAAGDQHGGVDGSLYSFAPVHWQKNWSTRYFGGLRIKSSTIELLYEFSYSVMDFSSYHKQILSHSIKLGFDV